MDEMLKFVQSSVVHVRDEHVLNKQKEPRVGPTLKKHCKSGDFEGNSYLGEDGLG